MVALATVDCAGERRWGVIEGERIRLAPPAVAPTLRAFIESGAAWPATGQWPSAAVDDVELVAPLPEPRRNPMCLGLNYADHAAEVQGVSLAEAELPAYPMVFTKATTAINGPTSDVVLDERVTRRLDWEAELAVIIGRGGRFIAPDEAWSHVFGYTVMNDLSAREIQKRHRQYFLGKSLDGSAPLGPWIVRRDTIADPHALRIYTRVNGVTKQDSTTAHMVFGIPRILASLSHVMTLLPGDIIATGTPGGVGFAREPREFLAPGDVVECGIDGIGTLRNRIVAPE